MRVWLGGGDGSGYGGLIGNNRNAATMPRESLVAKEEEPTTTPFVETETVLKEEAMDTAVVTLGQEVLSQGKDTAEDKAVKGLQAGAKWGTTFSSLNPSKLEPSPPARPEQVQTSPTSSAQAEVGAEAPRSLPIASHVSDSSSSETPASTHGPPPTPLRETQLLISPSTLNHASYIARQGYYSRYQPRFKTVMAADLQHRVPLEGMADLRIGKEEIPLRVRQKNEERERERARMTLRDLWEEGMREKEAEERRVEEEKRKEFGVRRPEGLDVKNLNLVRRREGMDGDVGVEKETTWTSLQTQSIGDEKGRKAATTTTTTTMTSGDMDLQSPNREGRNTEIQHPVVDVAGVFHELAEDPDVEESLVRRVHEEAPLLRRYFSDHKD